MRNSRATLLGLKIPYPQVILSALRHPENSLAFLGIEPGWKMM